MAYLGKSPHLGSYIKLDDISGSFDSTEVTFNLTSGGKPYYTTNPYTLFLVLGGVLQEPIISFTINQDQITFASAPTTGANCYIVVLILVRYYIIILSGGLGHYQLCYKMV